LESNPERYVQRLVWVFRHVRRVLRDDGIMFLNFGDSYNGSQQTGGVKSISGKGGSQPHGGIFKDDPRLKPKDLVGIPWRVAFALQQPYYTGCITDERLRYWMAGLVDGEGCFTILETTSPHGSGNSFPPVLQVRMCDIAPVERCAEITGMGTPSPKQTPPSQGGVRGSYQWRINARNAADIAQELYPHLTVKKLQALLVWNHQNVRDSYTTKRGKKIPKEALEKQKTLRSLIQRLNRSEDVDIPSWCKEPPPLYEPGWYLRSDCIWAKPNPMPESVTDRPTKAHEYIFLFSKSQRYFYDAEAVAEPHGEAKSGTWSKAYHEARLNHGTFGRQYEAKPTRNRRTVWTIATKPYSEAHFAVFPPELPEICIKAGTSEKGCCPECGAPWERVVERDGKGPSFDPLAITEGDALPDGPGIHRNMGGRYQKWLDENPKQTIGWHPTCECEQEEDEPGELIERPDEPTDRWVYPPEPCTVLDPFAGAGTTLMVALRLGRSAIGIELNPEYAKMARNRIDSDCPLFNRDFSLASPTIGE
jgi:hypothetical protein